MKQFFLYGVAILLALLFFWVYIGTNEDEWINYMPHHIQLLSRSKWPVWSSKDIPKSATAWSSWQQMKTVFEGEVLVDEEILPALWSNEACTLAFKDKKELPLWCQVDHILSLHRRDGEPFPAELFAIQWNDENVLPIGCRDDHDGLFVSHYGKLSPQISTWDKTKILHTAPDAPIFVKITKDDYIPYDVENPHCAVSWNTLEIKEKQMRQNN